MSTFHPNANSDSLIGRLPKPDPQLDSQESEWWTLFADLEADFCWVQTPEIQRIIRSHYIRRIVDTLPADAEVLELGCGTGWLSRLVAEQGAKHVVGVDFSSAQLAIAERETKNAAASGRVEFIHLAGDKSLSLAGRFDGVICHAFLHHLSTAELKTVLEQAKAYLKPQGFLFLFEPFRESEKLQAGTRFRSADWLGARLANLAHPSGRLRRTPVSVREQQLRQRLCDRPWGKGGRGPSPKEIPFTHPELEQLVSPCFNVVRRMPALIRAHQVAQEWLLMGESKKLSAAVMNTVIRMASVLDRFALASSLLPGDRWIFELWICSPRK